MEKIEFRKFKNEFLEQRDSADICISLSFEEHDLPELIEEYFYFLELCGFTKEKISNAICKYDSMVLL